MLQRELTEREKNILRNVIHQFILTASPVGSRFIAKKYEMNISAATIRNIMSDLEDYGFLNHPHTSAGRIPTDKGYRLYVDSLMSKPILSDREKAFIKNSLEPEISSTEGLLKITSSILSSITNQLACITFPKFDDAVLENIKIVVLSSIRILVVLSISSGNVKTITLELDAEVTEKTVFPIEAMLNEKLSGLKLSEIRKTFAERIRDYNEINNPILRLFIDSLNEIFITDNNSDKTFISGAKNIVKQPEFDDVDKFRSIIELMEDQKIVVHILEKNKTIDSEKVLIAIGKENESEWLSNYSTIIKTYKLGDASGTLGIIGPKRMQYSKTVATISYIADFLSEKLKVEI